MRTVFEKKEDCCGCGTCAVACPQGAIHMHMDKEGFFYPEVRPEACVDCGLCQDICPLRQVRLAENVPEVYAAKHRNEQVRMDSTSGGAFTALSDVILNQKGVVYGVGFDEGFVVCHQRAETAAQRDRFRFSKYVQSELRDTFVNIRDDLQTGKTVLFTGTPCQVAGLRCYLSEMKWKGRLYLCDVICYGIPSPLIFQEYKALLERENSSEIEQLQLRNKACGWSRSSGKETVYRLKGDTHIHIDQRFHQLYFGGPMMIRPSCFHCRFTRPFRVSDLTIADYWGVEKYLPDFADTKGISLIMTNTEKGRQLLKLASADLDIVPGNLEDCLAEQPRLREPVKLTARRACFWKEHETMEFSVLLERYTTKERSTNETGSR